MFAKCGTLTLNTSTGNQSVTGLGFAPKFIIFWMSGTTTVNTFTASPHFSFGCTTGAANSYSVSKFNEDAAATSNTSRRQAAKALTIVGTGESTLAEFDLVSFDSGGFTINLTTAATAWLVNYLAVGGDEVSAKLVAWSCNTATGNQSITGAGFIPTGAIHFNSGDTVLTEPSSVTGGTVGIGWTDGTTNGVVGTIARDNQAAADTARLQQTDSCVLVIATTSVNVEAAHVSFDADGETVNLSTAPAAARRMFTLFVKGCRISVGSFNKATGAGGSTNAITTTFAPVAALLMSYHDVTQATNQVHDRFGLGAGDGSNNFSSAYTDTDAVDPSEADGIDRNDSCFTKVNNNTPAVDARATAAIAGGTTTVTWGTNDAVATEMLYLAIGPQVRLLPLTGVGI